MVDLYVSFLCVLPNLRVRLMIFPIKPAIKRYTVYPNFRQCGLSQYVPDILYLVYSKRKTIDLRQKKSNHILLEHHQLHLPSGRSHIFSIREKLHVRVRTPGRKELQTALAMAIPTEFNGTMSFSGAFADEQHL